ncbi:MAG: hypothetical protein CK427_04505 [Leptospira sp.]|jgi:hypothetical protein|nr:MAG: hypothetical protein CK427_04505 [Leptospira sp.]
MSKMIGKIIFRIIFILVFFNLCKQEPQAELEKWVLTNQKADAIAMDKLAQLTFEHSYKSTEWKENGQLFIEYGGSSALTFSDKKKYVPMILLDLARRTYRTFFYGEKRGLKELRVSLVKPLYVQNAEGLQNEIQEFEIYRIKIDEDVLQKVRTIWNKEFPDSFVSDENGMPQGEQLEFLEIWQKNWKVELNQFSRIEVD